MISAHLLFLLAAALLLCHGAVMPGRLWACDGAQVTDTMLSYRRAIDNERRTLDSPWSPQNTPLARLHHWWKQQTGRVALEDAFVECTDTCVQRGYEALKGEGWVTLGVTSNYSACCYCLPLLADLWGQYPVQ